MNNLEICNQLEEGGAHVRSILPASSKGVVWERNDFAPFPDRPFVFTPIINGCLGSSVFDLTLSEAEAML